jgi:phage baseplate assembly protein W
MSPTRYRAWRFVHPDLAAAEGQAGLALSPGGGVAMVEGDDSVRQSILLLLSTVPGERVMRPEYGCYLYQLVFSPNDETTAGLAIHYVRRAVSRWEPRVEILRLDAGRHPDAAELLEIVLEYRVRASQRTERLEITLNLSGENR